ncbi:hypothetical protein D3C77_772020 [compost metagenome]
MAAQRLIGRHAVDVHQRGGQQHRGALIRQRADAAIGVGTDIVIGRDAVGLLVDAVRILRMRRQGRAQRGQGAGKAGGAYRA